jgi:small subunit ribosomal protein S20
MPHTSSAKKRLRQNAKRRLLNRAAKKGIRIQVKKVQEVADAGNLDDLKKEYNTAAMKLDQAAAKRVIHPNLAARKKSQLARLLNAQAKAGQQPAPAGK